LEEKTLLSIKEASNTLGVSEGALRQWTDEGKIEAFITPGGHRRYSKDDLLSLKNTHKKMLGVKDLAIGLEATTNMHREVMKSFANVAWYNSLSPESHQDLATLGRQLLNLIIQYVMESSTRTETTRLVQEVGNGFGFTLAKSGLPLTDSVEAFILHRNPILKAAMDLMEKKGAFAGRIATAIPLLGQVMDEALVSLVAAHQNYRSGKTNGQRGETLK
jgi:excisionase family DNA binding protein